MHRPLSPAPAQSPDISTHVFWWSEPVHISPVPGPLFLLSLSWLTQLFPTIFHKCTHLLSIIFFVLEILVISSRKNNSKSSFCFHFCSVCASDGGYREQSQQPTQRKGAAAFQNLPESIAIILMRPVSSSIPVLMKIKLFNFVELCSVL